MGNKVPPPTPSPPPETWPGRLAHYAIHITSTTGGLLHSASDTLSSALGYPRTPTIGSSRGETVRNQGSTKATRLPSSSERRSHHPTHWRERGKRERKKSKSKSKNGPGAVPNTAANVPDLAANVRVIVGDAWLQAGEIVEAAGVYAAELTSATRINFRLPNLKIAGLGGRDMNKHLWVGLALPVLLLLTIVCKILPRLFRSPRHKSTPVDSNISMAERERTVVATTAQDNLASPPALAPAEPENCPETRKDEVPPISVDGYTGDHSREVAISDQTQEEVSRPDNTGPVSSSKQCSEPSTGGSAADTKVLKVTGIYAGETLEDSNVGNDGAEVSCVNDASAPESFSKRDEAEPASSDTENLQVQMDAQGGGRLALPSHAGVVESTLIMGGVSGEKSEPPKHTHERANTSGSLAVDSHPGITEDTSILGGVSGEESELAQDKLESGNTGESTARIMLSEVGDNVPEGEACVTQDSGEAKEHIPPERQADDATEDSGLPQAGSVAVKSKKDPVASQGPMNLNLFSTSIIKGDKSGGKEKAPDLSAAVAAAGACDSAVVTALTNVERGARMSSVDPELQDPNAPANSHASTRPTDPGVPESISRMSPDFQEQVPIEAFPTGVIVKDAAIEKGDESIVMTKPADEVGYSGVDYRGRLSSAVIAGSKPLDTCAIKSQGHVATVEGEDEEPLVPAIIPTSMKGLQSTPEAGGEGTVEQVNEGARVIQVGVADPTPGFSGDTTPVVAEAVSDDNPSADIGSPGEMATATSMPEEKAQAMKEESVSEVEAAVGALRDAETSAIERGKEASAAVVGKGEEGMGIAAEIDAVTAAEAIAPVVLEAAVDIMSSDPDVEGGASGDASTTNSANPADITRDWAPSGDANFHPPALADSEEELAAPCPQEIDNEVSESTKKVTDPHDSGPCAESPGTEGTAPVSRPALAAQVIIQGGSREISIGGASSKQEVVHTAGGPALSNIQVTGGKGQASCGDGDYKEPMKEAKELEVEEVAVVELVDDEDGTAVMEKERPPRSSAPLPELTGDLCASMGGVVSAPVSVGSATSAQDISSHSARAVVYAKSDSESFPRALKVLLAINIGLHKLPVGARVLASAKRSRMNHNLLEQIRKGGSLFLRRRKRSHDEPLSSHRSETNSSTAPKKVTKILRGINKAFRHVKGESSSKEEPMSSGK